MPQVVVADARAAMAPVAARFHGNPTAELRVAGITGTNGKTTTAFLLSEVLEAAAIQSGLLGTVKQVVGAVEEEVERTTPEAIDLQDDLPTHARRAATGPARWRSPRTRSPCTGSTRSASSWRCSPT